MRRFADRFVLVREIGSGGMSTVFLGRDEVLDRPVAIKILKSELGQTDIGARFRREGRTAARLSHPNIVQVYDAGEGEIEGREASYIVMEYLPGGDLKGLIDERGSLPGDDLARLSGVADGLAHAHERGVIHRDIKPHNILLDENGSPKLADFGIARALDATHATRTGSYLGTAVYSSPEQLRGKGVSPKSDVYSLGVTLYHAATGRLPFVGSPIEVANQHVSKKPTPPRERDGSLSRALDGLILRCLEKDPDSRPTAEEVSLGLAQASPGAPAALAHPGPAKPSGEKPSGEAAPSGSSGARRASAPAAPRRRRWMLVLAALALVALAGALVVPALLDSGEQGANLSGRGGQNPGNAPGDGGAGGEGGRQAGEAGLTADAAEQTVREFYASAVRGDFDTAYGLLTPGWRQQYFPTRAELEATFEPVRDVTFVEGPTGEVSGDTATVTGVTRAELDTRTERNAGTWTLVNENGEWRISEWTVNRLSTRPA